MIRNYELNYEYGVEEDFTEDKPVLNDLKIEYMDYEDAVKISMKCIRVKEVFYTRDELEQFGEFDEKYDEYADLYNSHRETQLSESVITKVDEMDFDDSLEETKYTFTQLKKLNH